MTSQRKIFLLIEAIERLVASIGAVTLATEDQREAVKFALEVISRVRQK